MMDYSQLSTEALKFELRTLLERLEGLRMLIANYDESVFEDIHELEGQATGMEMVIEELQEELNRRQAS